VTLIAAPLIARLLTGKPGLSGDIRALSIVVGLTIASGGPAAYLHGTRQVVRYAAAAPLASIVATVFSVIALVIGVNLVWSVLVIAQLISTGTILVIGRRAFAVARAPRARVSRHESRKIVTLGLVFVTGSLALTASALGLRVLITRRLGLAATGVFQAGFGATATASAFLLQALTVDYYPRLAQTGRDDTRTNEVVNHQLEFSLNMVAPIALAAVLFAPVGIELLYSHKFLPGVHLAQIFALGEFMRVIAWCIGFVLVVREAKRAFLLTQFINAVTPIIISFALLPVFGLTACAIADVSTQALMLICVTVLAFRCTGFHMSRNAVRRMAMLWAACLAAIVAGDWSHGWAVQAALLGTVSVFSIRQFAGEFDSTPRLLVLRALRKLSITRRSR
jgi:PST family polysaccharide transporter